MIRKGLGVLTGVALMLAFAGQAGAFCVHNHSYKEMFISQNIINASIWRARRFTVKLGTNGAYACGNWQHTDFNKTGDPKATVSFDVYYSEAALACENARIPADGDLYITGKDGSYGCVAGSTVK